MFLKECTKGDVLRLVGWRGVDSLTPGGLYVAESDTVPGIFANRPFVSVINDNGMRTLLHLSRFVIDAGEDTA